MSYITKAFGSATIPAGETTTLTFTVVNDGEDPITEVGFTDTLPLDMVIANPNGLSNPSSLSVITAVEDTNIVSLVGAGLAAGEMASFAINVVVPTPGVYQNETSDLSTDEDGTISDSSGAASIAALASGFILRWALLRFDVKTRHEEET